MFARVSIAYIRECWWQIGLIPINEKRRRRRKRGGKKKKQTNRSEAEASSVSEGTRANPPFIRGRISPNIRARTALTVAPVSMFHEPRKICESLDIEGKASSGIRDPVSLPTPFLPPFHRMRVDATTERRGKQKEKVEGRKREGNKRGPTELAFWPFDGHPEIEFPLGR